MRRQRLPRTPVFLVVTLLALTGALLLSWATGGDRALIAAPGSPAPATPRPAATPTGAATPAATPVLVEITDDRYLPEGLRVPIGTRVRWVNRDGVTHTVSAFDGSFDSGPMHRGERFEVTFAEPGSFAYGCDLHLEMLGRLTVTPD